MLIGEDPPNELIDLLNSYPSIGIVHRAIHPYQVHACVRDYNIQLVFIRIHDWKWQLFECLSHIANTPKLVLIKDSNDRLDPSLLTDQDLFIRKPFTGLSLKSILGSDMASKIRDYDCIWIRVRRIWRRIRYNEILLIQKRSHNQIQICTAENDWWILSSVTAFLNLLPPDRFVRISDRLVIPVHVQDRITEQGYPFRGAWLPIKNTYHPPKKTRVDTINET